MDCNLDMVDIEGPIEQDTKMLSRHLREGVPAERLPRAKVGTMTGMVKDQPEKAMLLEWNQERESNRK